MRTRDLSYADVKAEFDSGGFLRTHILRPTWHFVAPEDIRWILGVTKPRVQQINQSRYRQLGLDQDQLDRGCALMAAALGGANHLTRRELGGILEQGGISREGQRLAHLVMNAELEGVICSGPMRGAQHTYALLEEWVAARPSLSDDAALAGLTRRFFEGHGPATLQEFTRWSSLKTVDAQAGLELVGTDLEKIEVAGHAHWFSPAFDDLQMGPPRTLLLPLYDEATLSYPTINFPTAKGHPHPPGMDLFIGSVIVDEVNVGTWRRTVQGKQVVIETDLAPGLTRGQRASVDDAVLRLAEFLDKQLVVHS
jgi:hypothetical protein